jgi:hypothetical protein
LDGKLAALNPNGTANPCGLIAKSVFTDTYTITDPKGINITINNTNISWRSDRKSKYKNGQDGNYTSY